MVKKLIRTKGQEPGKEKSAITIFACFLLFKKMARSVVEFFVFIFFS